MQNGNFVAVFIIFIKIFMQFCLKNNYIFDIIL